jgi:hypothetical protein
MEPARHILETDQGLGATKLLSHELLLTRSRGLVVSVGSLRETRVLIVIKTRQRIPGAHPTT